MILLLCMVFRQASHLFLVLANVPFALVGGVLAPACGELLRSFFAERRARQRAERAGRPDEAIPAGDATEIAFDPAALPADTPPADTP